MFAQEETLLLQVIDSTLHGKAMPAISPEMWSSLFTEMEAQCVAVLPAEHLEQFPLDDEQAEQYFAAIGKSIQYFYQILQEQDALVKFLRDAGIPSGILKGTSAAMSYPHPEYRTMGDIDVIVPEDDFSRAYEVLCSQGYVAENNETPQKYDRHIGFSSPSGIEVELHHHFSSSLHLNRQQNARLDAIIQESLSQEELVTIQGYACPALTPLANGLVLLGHIRQHLGDGLGLRQIIDWMMYVEKYLDDDFWKTSFEKASEECGMQKLGLVVTAMCQKYLGLPERITWCHSLDPEGEALCEQLLSYIVKRGNFGRKMDRQEVVSLNRLRMLKNPIAFFVTAQKFGMSNWKLLEKHPRLKCIAWLYQLGVWPIHAIKKGYTPASVLKHRKNANTEAELLNRLK